MAPHTPLSLLLSMLLLLTRLKIVNQSLPFQKIIHRIATVDAQPAGPDGSIIVMVTGGLLASFPHVSVHVLLGR